MGVRTTSLEQGGFSNQMMRSKSRGYGFAKDIILMAKVLPFPARPTKTPVKPKAEAAKKRAVKKKGKAKP